MAEGKPLKVALEAVGMAKSSYYYRSVSRRKPRALDKALVGAINAVRQGHAEVYGYRKVTMPSGLSSGQLMPRRYYDIFVPWD